MIIRRIDEDNYSVDGHIIGNIYDLHDYLNRIARKHIEFRQLKFMISHRSVARTMQDAIPDIEYIDEYYGIKTVYHKQVEVIKPTYSIVSAEDAHVHIKCYRTINDKPDHNEYVLNEDLTLRSLSELSSALNNLRIYLTEGQLRFILAHGLSEEQIANYPRLRFTSEKIRYQQDRRSAEDKVDAPSNSSQVVINRLDDTTYQYKGIVMDSFSVRKALAEDGFIINKNVLSMIFGQGKIPRSVAEKYPNLEYYDLRS